MDTASGRDSVRRNEYHQVSLLARFALRLEESAHERNVAQNGNGVVNLYNFFPCQTTQDDRCAVEDCDVQETIAKIDPMPGAKEFLDELRSFTQVIIISDTFTQFAAPLMKKLGWPTIFCNSLEVAPDGEITGFKMRIENSKYTTVKALQSIGFQTIASGDSYNDLGMIKASKAGFLFKSTDKIKADNPDLPAYETYDELMAAIKKAMD